MLNDVEFDGKKGGVSFVKSMIQPPNNETDYLQVIKLTWY